MTDLNSKETRQLLGLFVFTVFLFAGAVAIPDPNDAIIDNISNVSAPVHIEPWGGVFYYPLFFLGVLIVMLLNKLRRKKIGAACMLLFPSIGLLTLGLMFCMHFYEWRDTKRILSTGWKACDTYNRQKSVKQGWATLQAYIPPDAHCGSAVHEVFREKASAKAAYCADNPALCGEHP